MLGAILWLIVLIAIILSLIFVIIFFGRRVHKKLKLLRTVENKTERKKHYGAFLRDLGFLNGGISMIIFIFSVVLCYTYEYSLPMRINIIFTITLNIMLVYYMLASNYVAAVTSRLKNGHIGYLDSAFKSNIIDTFLLTILDIMFLYVISYINMWISTITLCVILIVRTLIIIEIHKEKPKDILYVIEP